MNPAPIRKAIAEALAEREAFQGATVSRYPRTPDQSDVREFVFGGITNAETEMVDLAGSSQMDDYEIAMALWWQTAGAGDDALAEAESKAVSLLADFRRWMEDVGHGKRLHIEDVVIDDMEVTRWDLGFRLEGTEAEIQFTLAISEVVA